MTLPRKINKVLDWASETVYIIAGGPSLEGFDFSQIMSKGITIGVNDSACRLNTDIAFSVDQTWIDMRKPWLESKYQGQVVLGVNPGYPLKDRIPNATYLERRRGSGMAEEPGRVQAKNSGFGALGLAYQNRAPRVILMGFDMGYTDTSHWYGGYEWQDSAPVQGLYPGWIPDFDLAAIQFMRYNAFVVNAGESSNITAFPKIALSTLLNWEDPD